MLLYINTCKCFTILILLMNQLSLVLGQVIQDTEEVTSLPGEIDEESFLNTIEFRVSSRISFNIFNYFPFLGNPWWCCRVLVRSV